MLIKLSGLVSAISGSLNGSVAYSSGGNTIMRTKTPPKNLQTASQTVVRSFFSEISKSWRGLTQAQIIQWNNAVQNFKGKNVFGNTKIPSGANLYQKLNLNLMTIGAPTIDVPPLPSEVPNVADLTVVAKNSDGTISLTMANAVDASVTGEVWATPAISNGVSFVKNQYRLIGTIDSSDTSTVSIADMYNAVFGAVGAAGQQIFVKVKPICTANGIPGVAVTASCSIQ